LPRYLKFIAACIVVPLGRKTAVSYAQTRLALKRKGRPIPMNDVWIAAQCLEQGWVLGNKWYWFWLCGWAGFGALV